MHIEQAMREVTTHHERALAKEVIRLREQLKKQEEDSEFYRIEGALYGTKFWLQKEEKEMYIEEAMDYMEAGGGLSDISRALHKEVKRLREQREVLIEEISGFTELSKETYDIMDEVAQEKQEKEETTVDQAISDVEKFSTSTSRNEILAAEVKRLQEDAKGRDKEVQFLHAKIQVLKRKVELMSENRQNIGDDLKAIWIKYW
ncbi:hypothetical protein LCGC14_1255590 [marine sediment metagenome]|uniref:Uncharacterized protein n=1 Tax=marine sediment metagenome TaxID=412755 RepID=A0A0F9LNF3_9ZZZZ